MLNVNLRHFELHHLFFAISFDPETLSIRWFNNMWDGYSHIVDKLSRIWVYSCKMSINIQVGIPSVLIHHRIVWFVWVLFGCLRQLCLLLGPTWYSISILFFFGDSSCEENMKFVYNYSGCRYPCFLSSVASLCITFNVRSAPDLALSVSAFLILENCQQLLRSTSVRLYFIHIFQCLVINIIYSEPLLCTFQGYV